MAVYIQIIHMPYHFLRYSRLWLPLARGPSTSKVFSNRSWWRTIVKQLNLAPDNQINCQSLVTLDAIFSRWSDFAGVRTSGSFVQCLDMWSPYVLPNISVYCPLPGTLLRDCDCAEAMPLYHHTEVPSELLIYPSFAVTTSKPGGPFVAGTELFLLHLKWVRMGSIEVVVPQACVLLLCVSE